MTEDNFGPRDYSTRSFNFRDFNTKKGFSKSVLGSSSGAPTRLNAISASANNYNSGSIDSSRDYNSGKYITMSNNSSNKRGTGLAEVRAIGSARQIARESVDRVDPYIKSGSAAHALKLVEAAPFVVEDLDFSDEDLFYKGAHSLHGLVPYSARSKAEFARFFIERYSGVGDRVLDPFVGSGTTSLEACLRARSIVAVDSSELALSIAKAKLQPADIAQVTLALQLLNVRRPVDSKYFENYFEPFYDIRTFCEILNLKDFVNSQRDKSQKEGPFNTDRVRNFIMALGLSLLHGHSSGHFSGYSYPQLAPSPKDQLALNIKRHQYPDYRPIIPRLIKRAAVVLRDGVPSVLERTANCSEVVKSDARDLSFIKTGSIDLVFTAPPIPQDLIKAEAHKRGQWLRNWFADFGINSPSIFEDELSFSHTEEEVWLDFMNEVLIEMARVVRPGSRLVFEMKQQADETDYSQSLLELVNSALLNFWTPEALYSVKDQAEALKNALKARNRSRKQGVARFLVLRRR